MLTTCFTQIVSILGTFVPFLVKSKNESQCFEVCVLTPLLFERELKCHLVCVCVFQVVSAELREEAWLAWPCQDSMLSTPTGTT